VKALSTVRKDVVFYLDMHACLKIKLSVKNPLSSS
jgi:hypothetical protein